MQHTPDARGVQHQAGSRSPPVDLLIRTGGERRLSDFLLWECAYADLVFSERVRLEFPILSLNPGLRQRCVAPDVGPTLSRA